jgi:predicted ATP-grasp superfamily ATP-dependent carboligase
VFSPDAVLALVVALLPASVFERDWASPVSAALKPAVVLGIDTPIGLSIIRDLGSRGVPVTGIGRHAGALGMSSRYLRQGLVRANGETALIEQLQELGRQLGPACLFAISESDIALLNRHREQLSGFALMFADEARMASVLNKEMTYAAAAQVGIRVPRTEQPGSMAEVDSLAGELRFPVVLKWANPNDVVATLADAGLILDKTHYCYTADELSSYLRPYEKLGIYPLIQEYCAGYGLGQFVLMHDGEAHYTFQHCRVHEWPPEGGFSSLCESLPPGSHPALLAQSIALLRALNWEGVAMVEYRHDPATGESALMEINGRFWGSLPLAYHAGAAFPWQLYRLFGIGQAVEQKGYRSGLRCRFIIPETKRLLRILFRQGAIADRALVFRRLPELAGYLVDFIRPRTCYYVFEWKDPMPFLSDVGQIAEALGRKVFRVPVPGVSPPSTAGADHGSKAGRS